MAGESTSETGTSAWRWRDVIAGGLRWHVCDAGAGADLLLLHGTGGGVHSWDGVRPALAESFHVVAPDLPGHGRSASPGFDQITLAGMASSVAELLRAIDVHPTLVVGHSAGAAIMLQLAADGALARATTLVGINPALAVPPAAAQGVLRGPVGQLLRSPAARQLVRTVGTMTPLIELLLASTGSRLSAEQERAYAETFRNPAHAESAYAMMANWDLRPLVAALPRIQQRTVFLVGENDRWVPPDTARQAAVHMPNATVVVMAGGGHLLHEEHADAVAHRILAAHTARMQADAAGGSADASRPATSTSLP